MSGNYFDSKKDLEIVSAGGFFCYACAVGKPAEEQSPDSRYCHDCYEFLVKEAELLPSNKRPSWIPRVTRDNPKGKNGRQKSIQVSQDVVLNMSTLNDLKSEVDIIQPSVAKVTHGKRGPKHKVLPHDLIMQWRDEGMGSKAIATRLRGEQGIDISYKTIQRVISGERN